MKSRIIKTTVAAIALSVVSLWGCETVVTDVNAELNAVNPSKDLGTPVNYNEDYVEVAYTPVADVVENTEEEDLSNTENREKNEEASSEDNTVPEKEDKNDSSNEDKDEKEGSEENEDTDDTDDTDEDGDEDEDENDTDEDDDDDEEDGDEDDEDGEENSLEEQMKADGFDPEFYAEMYPDVVAVFGNSPEALYKHYLDYGKAEGRKPHADYEGQETPN